MDNKKTQIKKKALKTFIQEGFQGARTQGIADAAGVNKALLHYYFKDKENLYLEVLDDLHKETCKWLDILQEKNPNVKIKLTDFVQYWLDLPRTNQKGIHFFMIEIEKLKPSLKRNKYQFPNLDEFHSTLLMAQSMGMVTEGNPVKKLEFLISVLTSSSTTKTILSSELNKEKIEQKTRINSVLNTLFFGVK